MIAHAVTIAPLDYFELSERGQVETVMRFMESLDGERDRLRFENFVKSLPLGDYSTDMHIGDGGMLVMVAYLREHNPNEASRR